MKKNKLSLIKKIIWLRWAQLLVNQRYKKGDFLVPIHLAMGHESISVAINAAMQEQDAIFLTHRNIHYNLARKGSLKEELDEYYLRQSGLAHGRLGSMNLSNPDKNIMYTSSILANNLSVGSGYALGNKLKKTKDVVFIVTGDGAIEEGAFYESLLFMKSNQLSSIIIVENNEWSLGTKIDERRADIYLKKLANSLGIDYVCLKENDPFEYLKIIKSSRSKAIKYKTPVLIEVELKTLGYWYLKSEEHPDGKFINYHCGPAPEVNEKEYPMLLTSNGDPLYVLSKILPMKDLVDISNKALQKLNHEIL